MNIAKAAATLIITALGFACPCSPVLAQNAAGSIAAPISVKPNLPSKKIIEYGWDQVYSTDLAYIRDNIREMEKRPFDGIAFCLPDPVTGYHLGGRVFHVKAYNEEKLKPQLKVLADIKWNKFTDNFLTMFAASDMDWFSDADWKNVLGHVRFMAQAAKAARCKGIFFDPEPYGESPWRYDKQLHKDTKSFAEYAVQARKRGKQFMAALAGEMPDMKLLMFYQYSLFVTFASRDIDPAKRNAAFNTNEYGLMSYFLDGMLEAAPSQVRLIDGSEYAADYFKGPLDYYRSYHIIRQESKLAVAPELRAKFDSQNEAAMEVYLDHYFNFRPEVHKASPGVTMTPEQRLRWFEHNTYYALKTTDEYVWLYNEEFNWYTNKILNGTTQPAALTADIEKAIISAKTKVQRGEELGFDVTEDIQAALAALKPAR